MPKFSRRDALICFTLAAVTFALYWPMRSAPFVAYDDNLYITENSHVQAGLTPANLRWALTAECAGNWHPLTLISHMLDCQWFGLNAGDHHLVNLVFHAANVLLLFWLLRGMTRAVWPAAMVAALFAWHPLHVQSVAWIAERKDVLSGFFALLSMIAYVRYANHLPDENAIKTKKAKPKLYYALTLFFFALGLLSKPMVVTLPFLLLLLDYWPLHRLAASQPRAATMKLILEKIPFFILSTISCVITYCVQSAQGATTALHLTMMTRLANALISYCRYLGKFIWPAHLAVLYPYESSFSATVILGAILLLTGLTAIFIHSARRRPYLLMGWLWFLGSLVPVIGLVQVGKQSMADRYTYLPSIGIFITAAWWLADLPALTTRRRVLSIICLSALMACLIQSWRQLPYWQSSEALFRHALDVTINNEVMEYDLGVVLTQEEKYDEALEHQYRALSLDVSDPAVNNAIGATLAAEGKRTEALDYYIQAEHLKSNYFAAHFNHAQILEKLGDFLGASNQYFETVQITPQNSAAHLAFGALLLDHGNAKDAKPQLKKAVELQPSDEAAQAEFASALNALGETGAAIKHFELALKINPSDYVALNNLAWIRAADAQSHFRHGSEAILLAQRACDLTQNRVPEIVGTLAAAYAETGDFSQAVVSAKKAMELALAAGQKDLAATNEMLMHLYEQHQPFHEPAKAK